MHTFTADKMKQWALNFENNMQLPFITTSALIHLNELEAFIATIKKQQADSVRVYFLRFNIHEKPIPQVLVNGVPAKGCEWLAAAGEFTQTAIAMVPAKNFKHDENFVFSADDISIGDKVTTLLPGRGDEGTGLNPPGASGLKVDRLP